MQWMVISTPKESLNFMPSAPRIFVATASLTFQHLFYRINQGVRLRKKRVLAGLLAATFAVNLNAASERTLSIEEYRDKMEAGWIGQMAGVSWAARTEFKFYNTIIPINEMTGMPEFMPEWTPELINGAFGQDDIYVEMTFLRSLEDHGFDLSYKQAGLDFANSGYSLWVANAIGRSNLRLGIAPPDSGHPQFNEAPNAIDYQIEADYSGLIAPGLPQVPIDLGEKFGRMMNYSDGVYAGQFIGAMYSEAFFETDMRKVVDKGLAAIPAESQYAEVVRDVIAWYEEGIDWQACWQRVIDKYAGQLHTKPGAKNNYLELHHDGIDVRVNGAYVVIGLLYGGGDLDETIIISTRCGDDSDCNPSNAAGILFTSIGMKDLPERFTSGLDREKKFSYTPYNFTSLSEVCLKLAKIAVERAGGQVVGDDASGHFVIPQKAVTMKPYVSAARPEPIANSRFTEQEMARIVVSDARMKREVARFFPGWDIINCADLGVTGIQKKKYAAFVTLPKSEDGPSVLKKSVDVPAGKKTTLKLSVASLPEIGEQWQLMVRVDMADHYVQTIEGEKKLVWKELEIDLSKFAGQTIDLELYNNPVGDWTKSLAAWKSIEIVSE
jgi:hypothetical protein